MRTGKAAMQLEGKSTLWVLLFSAFVLIALLLAFDLSAHQIF